MVEKLESSRVSPDRLRGVDKRTDNTEVEYVLAFARRIYDGEAHAFDFADELPHQEHIGEDSENTWTKMYRAIFVAARHHPEFTQQLGEMAGMIGQNPQMMHPRHLLDIASDYVWDPRIHSYLKGDVVHSLGYAMRFFEGSDYEGAIAQKLDFTNTQHFSDTAHFLEFMQNLYNIGDEYSYGDNFVISRVHNALERAVEKKQGSYLLNVRAQELLGEMDGRSWVSGGFDRVPFIITKDRYARHKEDGLYVSAPEQRDQIEKLIREFGALEAQIRPPQHLVDEAIANGEDEVIWTPDQALMRRREVKYREIDAQFTHRLTYAELAPDDKTRNVDERAIEEHDFAYLERRPIREKIKDDFGVELQELSLQDQHKLLRTLKTVEYGKATPLLVEATRAMWGAGIRNYLEYVRDIEFERMSGPEVPEKLRRQVPALYMKCHAGDRPEYLEQIIGDSEKHLNDEHSYFYLLSHQEKLIGMMRFDEKRNAQGKVTSLYAGGLNVDPKFGGGRIGDEIIDKTFQNERKRGLPIDFHVPIVSPLALRYFRGDFVSDKIETRENVKRFHFVLEPTKKYTSKSGGISSEEIMRRAENAEHTDAIMFEVFSAPPEKIPRSYVLTRLVPSGGKYYAAFESVASEERLAA